MSASRFPRVRSFLGRRKRLIIAIAFIVAIVYLPMFPYSPDCLDSSTPTSVGSIFLAEDYRKGLTAHLKLYGVPYVSVGDLVLLRFWTWFMDPDSWVLNASDKTVEPLAQGKYYSTGKPVPPRVQEMVKQARKPDHLFIDLECPLVHAVAIEGW